jgi:hypothetical protein
MKTHQSSGNLIPLFLLAALILPACYTAAQNAPATSTVTTKAKNYDHRGIIYQYRDPHSGKVIYVGQSHNDATFERRKDDHVRKKGWSKENFEVISRPHQADLSVVEERFVRKRGTLYEKEINPEGRNMRHEVREERLIREESLRRNQDSVERNQRRSDAIERRNERYRREGTRGRGEHGK